MSELDQELFARILDDPDDDHARLVYADALLERGDPYGEFIRLSCEQAKGSLVGRSAARLRALRAHEARWLGKVAPVTSRKHRRYDRGFLVGCDLAPGRAPGALRASIGALAWSLVHSLSCTGETETDVLLELMHDPTMARLRVLDNVDPRMGPRLFETTTLALTEVVMWAGGRAVLEASLHGAGLPQLERLRLIVHGDSTWTLDTPIGRRLAALELSCARSELPRWLVALETCHHRLGSLRLGFGGLDGWNYTIRRGGDQRWSMLSIDRDRDPYPTADTLAGVIETLAVFPADALTQLAVELPAGADGARITAASRRQTRLVELALSAAR